MLEDRILSFPIICSSGMGRRSIHPGAQVKEDITVTGLLNIGEDAVLDGKVTITAGTLIIDEGTTITGKIKLSAGLLTLKAVRVNEGVSLIAGTVNVGRNSVIKKGIRLNSNIQGEKASRS